MTASPHDGHMAPIKAALDSSIVFLAKAFGEQRVRFNAVQLGLLETKAKASAGIPDDVPAYLFAEQATIRHEALRTEEEPGHSLDVPARERALT